MDWRLVYRDEYEMIGLLDSIDPAPQIESHDIYEGIRGARWCICG